SILDPRRPPSYTLFPYTTLFRSLLGDERADRARALVLVEDAGGLGHLGLVGLAEEAALGERLVEDPPQARRRVGDDLLGVMQPRSEEHTSELQSPYDLVCRLLLE